MYRSSTKKSLHPLLRCVEISWNISSKLSSIRLCSWNVSLTFIFISVLFSFISSLPPFLKNSIQFTTSTWTKRNLHFQSQTNVCWNARCVIWNNYQGHSVLLAQSPLQDVSLLLFSKVIVSFVESLGKFVVLYTVVFNTKFKRVVVKIYLEVSFGLWIFQKVRSNLRKGFFKKSLNISLTSFLSFADHNIFLYCKEIYFFKVIFEFVGSPDLNDRVSRKFLHPHL